VAIQAGLVIKRATGPATCLRSRTSLKGARMVKDWRPLGAFGRGGITIANQGGHTTEVWPEFPKP